MIWIIIAVVLFTSYVPGLFRLMKLAHDESVRNDVRRTELVKKCVEEGGPDNSLSGCAERTGGHP